MERKSSKSETREKTPTRTIEELESMLEFAVSQIAKLNEAGSKDKTLLEYLNTKKIQAETEIARLRALKPK
ncbi:hypothetical protein A2738_00980 [Candidatus Nomurabacteria bacterium RIFCSPHIGHO2_01_FULL_42_15]|uniref:Uncharacterized protein n=1 Tax=Candidatus Nomurabacteria bacterium RIFCSPHIGHO2_01_FULL_42_15 TaxID=1801742 RepID=A0A1F6VFK8_9BACT|nr:MAG: hypothetical protein A2738_00980 [Candidatus Nomurabacteria bacterium RIFCSPHIGHO2_01_FULL_42_15]OGI93134.1 MAG: hypothetical protein A3A99_01190 [Candidatus Nomurabacteria bacterium RIFCSPLOWO2_01_FULL_41_18]